MWVEANPGISADTTAAKLEELFGPLRNSWGLKNANSMAQPVDFLSVGISANNHFSTTQFFFGEDPTTLLHIDSLPHECLGHELIAKTTIAHFMVFVFNLATVPTCKGVVGVDEQPTHGGNVNLCAFSTLCAHEASLDALPRAEARLAETLGQLEVMESMVQLKLTSHDYIKCRERAAVTINGLKSSAPPPPPAVAVAVAEKP
jgi:hypothetical protein